MKIAFAVLSVFLTTMVIAGESWPSFQNGGNTDRIREDTFSLDDIKWTVDLQGYGQSSPIVWQGVVYTTTVKGDNKEQCYVTAHQLSDGKQLWQYMVTNASPFTNTNYVSRAAPSPVADSEGIVCLFEGGNLVALSHNGTVRWERNLVADYGEVEARHGLAASLEQNTDSVFAWIERSDDPYVVCLNKVTGDVKWKSAGAGATSWSSPRLVPVDNVRHLVLSASGKILGVDPKTGKHLWTFDKISGNTTPTPIPLGDGRFLIGASAGRGASAGSRAPESNGVIQISDNKNGSWSATFVWHAKRATSSFGSPVVHAGMAYFVNRAGVLYGLEMDTGKEIFAKRLTGSTWATPISVGQQILFFGRDGKINMLHLDETPSAFSIWDELPVSREAAPQNTDSPRSPGGSGPVLYAAVWCEDILILRRGNRLFAVNTESKGDSQAP